jgi:hypothetical protein
MSFAWDSVESVLGLGTESTLSLTESTLLFLGHGQSRHSPVDSFVLLGLHSPLHGTSNMKRLGK